MNRAVQTGHPPLVLVLDVAAGAVADDDDGDIVLTGGHVGRHVVLARQPAVGAVPHEDAVDVHRVHALGTADLQHDLRALPGARHSERGSVQSSRISVRQGWRRPAEGHLHVGVVRVVASVLHRPVAGNRDSRDCGVQRRRQLAGDRGLGYDVGMIEESERPRPVERSPIRTRQRHVHRQPADRGDRRVGPWPELSDDRQHQRARKELADNEITPCWLRASSR